MILENIPSVLRVPKIWNSLNNTVVFSKDTKLFKLNLDKYCQILKYYMIIKHRFHSLVSVCNLFLWY